MHDSLCFVLWHTEHALALGAYTSGPSVLKICKLSGLVALRVPPNMARRTPTTNASPSAGLGNIIALRGVRTMARLPCGPHVMREVLVPGPCTHLRWSPHRCRRGTHGRGILTWNAGDLGQELTVKRPVNRSWPFPPWQPLPRYIPRATLHTN
jgi:hypothetical protein